MKWFFRQSDKEAYHKSVFSHSYINRRDQSSHVNKKIERKMKGVDKAVFSGDEI